MYKADLAALALCVLCALPLRAQPVDTGFLNRTVSLEGQDYRYQVYVPADYAARTDWPVILFLHGAGERGEDGLRQTAAGLGPSIRHEAKRYPAIVVFPQVRAGLQWSGVQADVALAALARTLREFKVDPDRVYLTGLSMGGHGTWYIAYRHPELFAAIAPICGWTKDLAGYGFLVPVVPAGTENPLQALAQRLAKVPTWIFHGEMDGAVPVRGSREAAEALGKVSTVARYTEYPGMDHNVWDSVYGSESFIQWLFAQRRVKR